MDATVGKWGNSLGLRISKKVAKKLNLAEGVKIEMKLEKNKLIIRRRRKNSLKSLVEQITPENLHGEINFGSPEGRETW